ncbi:UNVERIFIED_CONTAM: hypothetical protein Sindi_0526800 [Sesamum indicum]
MFLWCLLVTLPRQKMNSEFSASQSRADLLTLGLAVTNILNGLVWEKLTKHLIWKQLSQGNPVEKEQEEEIRCLLDRIDFDELDGDGNESEGDGRKDCEGQGVGGDECEGDGRKDCEGQGIEGQGLDGVEIESVDCEGQGGVALGDDVPITENVEIPIQNNSEKMTEKGKRKMYERFLNESSSEFDDSSDEDYVQVGENEWASDDGNEDDLVSLEGSDDNENEKHPVFKESDSMKNVNLVVGMKFQNAAQFRVALRDWCIRNGVDIEFLKNEAARVTAKCKVEGCEWRIHASPIQGGPTFQIKTMKDKHTCARTYENRLANASYLAKRIENAIRDNPTIPIQQLKNRIRSKCNVDVSRFKVMRAKKEALQRIRGDDAKQYELLWDYCETVRNCNPGSKLILKKLENSDPPVFDRMYFSLHALKKGFMDGCRPIIGLDGCFLKTVYGGQLLVAVGRDGNDNMFPIAMAVTQVENRDTWGWFVSELLDEIGGLGTTKYSFISDRQKGLVEALKDLVPDAEHRFCLRHMYENFKVKFKSVELKEYFWRAASTANRREFEGFMKKIEELDPKIKVDVETASEWLRKINPQHWARSHFPVHSKCDILVNNLCESFNNYILEARDKPIISMFEWIRTKLMSRLQLKREGMEKYGGSICPNILKKINKQQHAARNCFIRWCGGGEYEIDHFLNKYVVDLEKKTCSCGMFQLTGYPCCHACSAIVSKRARMDDYVDDFYKKTVYLKVYNDMIHAVPGAQDYIKTSFQPFKPPKIKKKRGRPKKLRRKGPNELQSNTSTRKGLTHTCSKCLQIGHNKGSCKNEIHPKSKFFKVNVAVPEEIPHGSQAPPPLSQEQPSKKATSKGKRKGSNVVQPPAPAPDFATQTNVVVPVEIPHGSQAPPTLSQEQPSKKATSKEKRKNSNVVQPPAPAPDFATQVGYQGPRNASLLGNDTPAASSIPATRRYNKRPTISQVLDKMKERQKRRQQE